MKVILIWMLVSIVVYARGSDEDFVDTDSEIDTEAKLKCDACKAVASKFIEYFSVAQRDNSITTSMKDEDIIEAAESTCDDTWEGYGVIEVDGEERLSGPGTDVTPKSDVSFDPIWPRRLQDMCDELLGEAPDEKTLYNIWISGSSLEDYLCKGDGPFGACSAEDWGPWPGDDYEDYEDGDDFDYVHDEF